MGANIYFKGKDVYFRHFVLLYYFPCNIEDFLAKTAYIFFQGNGVAGAICWCAIIASLLLTRQRGVHFLIGVLILIAMKVSENPFFFSSTTRHFVFINILNICCEFFADSHMIFDFFSKVNTVGCKKYISTAKLLAELVILFGTHCATILIFHDSHKTKNKLKISRKTPKKNV